MATASLHVLHLPFSTTITAPSFPSRLPLPLSLPLKPTHSPPLVCKAKECYNVEVIIEDDEPAELCMRYFEREVSRAGIPQEWRRRRFRETKKEERIRKAQDRARLRRRRSGGRSSGGKTGTTSRSNYEEEEEEKNEALVRLLDTDYQEGSLELLEMDLPEEVWEADSNGEPLDF